MFDGRWRDGVDRTTGPIGAALQRIGITADVLTASGLVFAIATAVAVGSGHLLIAIPLLAITGFHDLLDGPVAKAAGTASVRGAFFDSVTDRVADGVLMGGVSWYLINAHKGHLAVLPLAILGVTSLVSYQRAKAESLGLDARGGLMERAERMILLGIGFFATWLLIPVLWVLLASISATAIGRFVKVWKQAEGPARKESTRTPIVVALRSSFAPENDKGPDGLGPVRHIRARARKGAVDSRWRNWREGATPRSTVGRAGEPTGRWRARRQEALASRSGRAMRARRSKQTGRAVPRRGLSNNPRI